MSKTITISEDTYKIIAPVIEALETVVNSPILAKVNKAVYRKVKSKSLLLKLMYTMKDLEKAIDEGDNEHIHSIYDALIEQRLEKLDIRYFAKLREKVEGIDFWYA